MGHYSHNNKCFDIGRTTRGALEKFITSEGTDDSPASTDHFDSGNGGIMRMAPAVLAARSKEQAQEYSVLQSETTHASEDCLTWSFYLGGLLWDLINENSTDPEPFDIEKRTRDEVKSSGYVTDTAEAALWCFTHTDNFRDAVLLAANLGDDADTVAAVSGQIVGSRYGYSGIPEEWLRILIWHDKIEELANKLILD